VSRDGKRVLLVTSTGVAGRWVIPAGTLEADENAEQGAVRETEEEAGIGGEVLGSLGLVDESYLGKRQTTHYFLVEAHTEHKEFIEQGFRERAWFYLDDAKRELAWRTHYVELIEQLEQRHDDLIEQRRRRVKEGAKAEKKKADAGKKNWLLRGMPELTERFGPMVALFGAEQTARWLARCPLADARDPVDGFGAVKACLVEDSLTHGADEGVAFAHWLAVTQRLQDCHSLAKAPHRHKCYKRFLLDAWSDRLKRDKLVGETTAASKGSRKSDES